MRAIILFASLGILATPAGAQVGDPAQPEKVVVEGQKEKKVCRTEVPLGSNLPRRICTTLAESKARAKENERRTDAYIRDKNAMSGRVLNCSGGVC